MSNTEAWNTAPIAQLWDIAPPESRADAPPFESMQRTGRWLEPMLVEQAIKETVHERVDLGYEEVDPRALGWDLLQAIHKMPGAENPAADRHQPTREELLRAMTERFLQWTLPEDFSPDAGIEYEPVKGQPAPVGTNLLNYDQAEAMLRRVVFGE